MQITLKNMSMNVCKTILFKKCKKLRCSLLKTKLKKKVFIKNFLHEVYKIFVFFKNIIYLFILYIKEFNQVLLKYQKMLNWWKYVYFNICRAITHDGFKLVYGKNEITWVTVIKKRKGGGEGINNII